ncbi:hypothetical protein AVEN_48360-1 [Araneus ventricosus]|uniref:Uncharacterized protein n=1 Tax=Araneus ventricosus TaxID=182803 RepID=A0A4Y2EVW7_ARAVE|nr:hypothetical protein AVEN_48360-1 [Araneus ventricosus]
MDLKSKLVQMDCTGGIPNNLRIKLVWVMDCIGGIPNSFEEIRWLPNGFALSGIRIVLKSEVDCKWIAWWNSSVLAKSKQSLLPFCGTPVSAPWVKPGVFMVEPQSGENVRTEVGSGNFHTCYLIGAGPGILMASEFHQCNPFAPI